MVAEALLSGIRALGFRKIEFELTPHGAALGLAEALPAAGLELRVTGSGRGVRRQDEAIQVRVHIAMGGSTTWIDAA